jgi:hypothetical protein
MKHVRKRLTYANVMSSIAVFLVLGGATAFAATKIGANEIKANSIKTGKIVKEAVTAGKIKAKAVTESRIADGAVTSLKLADNAVTTTKLANKSVTGAKLDLPSIGTVPTAQNAANAEKLGGKGPSSYESKGFTTGELNIVNLPASATTTVATLDLPAGTYFLLSSGVINSNSAAPIESVSCTVSAGGKSQANDFGTLNKLSEPGDRDSFSAPLVATLDTAGAATFTCRTPAGWSGNIVTPALSAVSLQP